jgi:hypothetical protein
MEIQCSLYDLQQLQNSVLFDFEARAQEIFPSYLRHTCFYLYIYKKKIVTSMTAQDPGSPNTGFESLFGHRRFLVKVDRNHLTIGFFFLIFFKCRPRWCSG